MTDNSDSKRPGTIVKPTGMISSKVIESRSKSYSDLSSKQHLKSHIEEESCSQEGFYAVGWGRNRFNEYPQADWNIPVVEVACGEKHSVLLTNRFELFACGDNQHGQLGLPTSTYACTSQPIQIMKDKSLATVFCGPYQTFVQTSKGEIYGMGLNNRGQLGIGNTTDQKSGPVLLHAFSISKKINRQVSRGRIVTTNQGILTDRHPSNDNPTLRQHTPEKRYRFFEADDEKKSLLDHNDYVKQIACGPFHTLVLTGKGRIFSSGVVLLGSQPSASKYVTEFQQIKLLFAGTIEQISACLAACAARTSEGRVYVWGVIGNNIINEPFQIDLKGVIDVSIGGQYQCLLTAKGEVFQLYANDTEGKIRCNKVEDLPHVRSIRCGMDFALALATQSKQVYAWGRNKYGQVTDSKPSQSISTVPVLCRTQEVSKIACGSYYTVCLGKKPAGKETSFNEVSYSRKESTEQQKPQENSSEKTRKQQKRSVRTQTDPMSKFEMSHNVAPRTFSTTLEIPFSEIILEKQISEGGYGIIYKGKWRETIVAVKLFKIDTSQSSVKDFLSECHAMEALRHPNIVLFLGACTKPPNFAIVLEYCSKGTLWSLLQSSVELSWEDRRRFALDTARGMNYLHACQVPILHRDLKSLNLLLDESYRVKLADFGWTKGLENYMTEKIGTYQWMAPEVISGQKYTEKADVFSFGIILWQIASREPPYRNVSGIQVSIEVANNHLRPPIPKKTPEAFARLMKKCWDRNPEARPSFKQAIRELENMKLVEGK